MISSSHHLTLLLLLFLLCLHPHNALSPPIIHKHAIEQSSSSSTLTHSPSSFSSDNIDSVWLWSNYNETIALQPHSFYSNVHYPTMFNAEINNTSPSSTSLLTPSSSSPSSSTANSILFPSFNPFNKGNLLKLRGVNYQPTPIGQRGDNLDLYTLEFRHLHQRDLRLMYELGVNAIRIWSWSSTHASQHLHFLNMCWHYQIYVIISFRMEEGKPKGVNDIGGKFSIVLFIYCSSLIVLI